MTRNVTAGDAKRDRVERGLCPQCGEDAAPYYLCPRCRATASMRRMLNRAERHGIFKSERRGAAKYWSLGTNATDAAITDVWAKTPLPLWGQGRAENDARLRPRVGRMPIKVEEELIAALRQIGEPVTEDEIVRAWGRLRVRGGRVSAALDLAALIAAEKRRQRRNDKRLAQGANT